MEGSFSLEVASSRQAAAVSNAFRPQTQQLQVRGRSSLGMRETGQVHSQSLVEEELRGSTAH